MDSGLAEADRHPLIDDGNYPSINAYGIADIYLLPGNRARFVLFDWCRIDGIFIRRVCGMVTRLVTDFDTEQRELWRRVHATVPVLERH